MVSLDTIVDNVALGRLVIVAGESVADRLGRSVTAVPVQDLPGSMLVLAWRPNAPHPARAEFVRVAQNIATRASQQRQAP